MEMDLMKHTVGRIAFLVVTLGMLSLAATQHIAPPAPQQLMVHSNVLNEDRVVWVRTPHGYG